MTQPNNNLANSGEIWLYQERGSNKWEIATLQDRVKYGTFDNYQTKMFNLFDRATKQILIDIDLINIVMQKEKKTAIELVIEKRNKHTSKGWTIEHDLEHNRGELAIVAATLAVKHTDAFVDGTGLEGYLTNDNPWGLENNADHIDRLAVAASLLLAEIDRLLNN